MLSFRSVCRKLAGHCVSCVVSFAIWSLWLLLVLALAVQVWIASSHEVVLAGPVLRFVENHLSTPSYRVSLGRVVFDPSGHLVVQSLDVELPGFDGPILSIGQLETRLDPWGLLAGHVEAHQLEITGARLLYPSQLSPTGRAEPIIDNLDASLHLEGNRVDIGELSASAGPIAVFAHGGIALAPLRGAAAGGAGRFDAAKAVDAFVGALRKAAKVTPRLDALQGVRLDLTLFPSPIAGAIVDAEASATRLRLTAPHAVNAGPFHVRTRFPLAGPVSARVIVRADVGAIELPEGSANNVSARLVATWNPHHRAFAPQFVNLSASRIQARGVSVDAVLLRAHPAPLPGVSFEAEAAVADARLGLSGTVLPAEKSGHVSFAVEAGSGLEKLVSDLIHKDLGHFVTFTRPASASGTVDLLPGGRLAGAQAWVDARDFTAHEVHLDRITGHVTFDGKTFSADHAVVLQGQNVARGTYEMDMKTHDFRFLLSGYLRPLEIEGWFKPWWPTLWKNFDFPAEVPAANVDIRGRWRFPALTTVFAGVDASHPVVKTVPFEHVRTRVYVHSHDVEALHIDAVRKEGWVRGWFSRTYDPEKATWKTIDFDMHTKVNLVECAGMFRSIAPEMLAPYSFENPPEIHASGHLEGPASPLGPGEDIAFSVRSDGTFAYKGFPVHDVSFEGTMRNHTVDVSRISAVFAGGKADGRFSVAPDGRHKRIKVQATLKGARLGDIVQNVEEYAARVAKRTPAKATKEERMSKARLDAEVNADGLLGDITSFHGNGSAELTGAEIGQVRLLGGLSELLRFTALRFTNAKTTFKLAGPEIDFQNVRVTGRNSAIDAHGTYSLATRKVDFKAKVWPFEQSDGLVRGTFGLVLSPFTVFLEVKLTGTLADPSWSFVYSPFRALNAPAVPAPGTPSPAQTPTAPVEPPKAK